MFEFHFLNSRQTNLPAHSPQHITFQITVSMIFDTATPSLKMYPRRSQFPRQTPPGWKIEFHVAAYAYMYVHPLPYLRGLNARRHTCTYGGKSPTRANSEIERRTGILEHAHARARPFQPPRERGRHFSLVSALPAWFVKGSPCSGFSFEAVHRMDFFDCCFAFSSLISTSSFDLLLLEITYLWTFWASFHSQSQIVRWFQWIAFIDFYNSWAV